MLQPGTLLQGRYRVIRALGQGGFSQTYEVEDGGVPKVLKVLLENYPKTVDLLQREARVLSQLNYPGVPKVEPDAFFVLYPQNSAEPLHCLVMEKIPGLDLKQWLAHRHHQPINQVQALDWLKQLTEILEQLHQQSFFHRDIKPSNIILKPDGKLVLIDFGSARQITKTYLKKSQARQTGTRLQSLGYAPLEQIDGKAVPQSDFFALGRTFVHLLTGNPPYDFSSDPSTGQLRWRREAPHISASLADLIDWLIAPFPGQRPQNTQVILQVLAAMQQKEERRWVEFTLGGLWGGVATGILIGMRLLGSLQVLELKAFDQMMQWRPLEGPDEHLLLVDVTRADIQGLGNEFPKPDQTILQLIQKLDEYQPLAIGLNLYQNGPEGEGRPELIQYLQQHRHIVSICVHPNPHNPSGVAPLPQIPENQLGFADVVLDPSDIVRRHLLGATPGDDSSCPASYALSTQLALLYLEAKGYTLTFLTANTWQLHKEGTKPINFHVLQTHRGFYPQPEMARGHQILLNYRRLSEFHNIVEDRHRFRLTDILNDQVNPSWVKDKIVLVGITDPNIEDNFNTPYNQKPIRGVVLHTTMVSQLISAVEEGRPLLQFWPLWGDMLWILSWSEVSVILTWRLQTGKSARARSWIYWGLASGAILLSLSQICFLLLLIKGVVLPFVPSVLVYVVAGGGIIFYKQIQVKNHRLPIHLKMYN